MTEDTPNRPQGMAKEKVPKLNIIPSNPRYKGATPEMVGKALMKAKPKKTDTARRPVKRVPSSI